MMFIAVYISSVLGESVLVGAVGSRLIKVFVCDKKNYYQNNLSTIYELEMKEMFHLFYFYIEATSFMVSD